MEHECPICYENTVSIFTNISCKHTWCKECHHKLIEKKHTECVMCRAPIILKKKIKPRDDYINWLIEGGEPFINYRRKRHKWKYIKWTY